MRTIKNYLAGALQPVGQALYVWGGRLERRHKKKGVSPIWKQWYNSQDSSYNYKNYKYQREKGLDCSGFVGWAAYQVMHSKSGEGERLHSCCQRSLVRRLRIQEDGENYIVQVADT